MALILPGWVVLPVSMAGKHSGSIPIGAGGTNGRGNIGLDPIRIGHDSTVSGRSSQIHYSYRLRNGECRLILR